MPAFPHLIRQTIDTPTGELCLVADSAGSLYAVDWLDRQERMSQLLGRYHRGHAPVVDGDVVPSLVTAFQRYFDGDLHAIDALPCAHAGTAFQQRVWTALRAIPCGETMSYGDLAHRLGSVAAVRAVGMANGANPVSIVIPCHRVIGVKGALTGYGGGLARKQWLLAHERRPHTLQRELLFAD